MAKPKKLEGAVVGGAQPSRFHLPSLGRSKSTTSAPQIQDRPSFAAKIKNMPKKKLLICVLALAFIISGSILIVRHNKNRNPSAEAELKVKPEDPAVIAKRVDEAKKMGSLRDEAAKQIDQGNLAKADQLYDEAVGKETDAVQKIKLYLDLSSVYYAKSRYDNALSAADKASKLSEDQFLVSFWLAKLYEGRFNFAKSAEYYLLAAKWADSKQNNTGKTKTDLENDASRVKQEAERFKGLIP